jgi:hypothetical protein
MVGQESIHHLVVWVLPQAAALEQVELRLLVLQEQAVQAAVQLVQHQLELEPLDRETMAVLALVHSVLVVAVLVRLVVQQLSHLTHLCLTAVMA